MQRLLLVFLLLVSPLAADLRINELLPDTFVNLAVNPYIPENFVALPPPDRFMHDDAFVFWGPKDVLEAFFKNPDSLKSSIIKVGFSTSVAQTGPDTFNNKTYQESIKEIQEQIPGKLLHMQHKWGDYPLNVVKIDIQGHCIPMAWVGLNDPNGWTMTFNLISPDKNANLTKADHQLWDDFIKKTTKLSDHDFIKAQGQDLQDGFTEVNIGGTKLKMIAEKRESDGKVQVVVIPGDEGVNFTFKGMSEGRMGAQWRYGEPLIKVSGQIVSEKGNSCNIIDHTTSIFPKNVTEFSYSTEENPDLQIIKSS